MAFLRAVTQITQGEPPATERLAEFDGPLLLAQHIDCLLWTAEGFEDAGAAFPDARVVRCREIPPFDLAFGEALRDLAGG